MSDARSPSNSGSENIPTCFWCGREFKSPAGLESHLRKYVRDRAISQGQKDEVMRGVRSDCQVEGCDSDAVSRGLCHYHYSHLQRYGKPVPAERPLHGKYGQEVLEAHGLR